MREILRREGYAAMLLVESALRRAGDNAGRNTRRIYTPRWKTSCAHAKPYASRTATASSSAAVSNASAFCAHGKSVTVKMRNANR